MQRLLLATLLLASCQRSSPSTSAPAPSVAPSTPSPSPSASTSVVPLPPRPLSPAQRVVLAWSSALDRHATEDLPPLYAPRVQFYGQTKTAEQVIAAKKAALEKAPGYRQSIDRLKLEPSARGFVATFEKRSGPELKALVSGRLVLEKVGERLLISEESDAVTDERFKKPDAKTCSELGWEVAGGMQTIQRENARVAREHPDVNPGGLIFEEGPGFFVAAMGYHHIERFETRWYIEGGDGKLEVVNTYTGEVYPLNPSQQASAKALCNGKLPSSD